MAEGSFGWSHPEGDEVAAQIADDILEGRMDASVQLRRAEQDAKKAKHEANVFEHGLPTGPGKFTYQNKRRIS